MRGITIALYKTTIIPIEAIPLLHNPLDSSKFFGDLSYFRLKKIDTSFLSSSVRLFTCIYSEALSNCLIAFNLPHFPTVSLYFTGYFPILLLLFCVP